MSKKGYILSALVLTCLVTMGLGLGVYFKRQQLAAQRYHLYCKLLKPGMTEENVRKVLGQFGRFVDNDTEYGNNATWWVAYYDPKVTETYGGVFLLFVDHKYVRAYIEGFELELVEVLCDFSQPTISATGTPLH